MMDFTLLVSRTNNLSLIDYINDREIDNVLTPDLVGKFTLTPSGNGYRIYTVTVTPFVQARD